MSCNTRVCWLCLAAAHFCVLDEPRRLLLREDVVLRADRFARSCFPFDLPFDLPFGLPFALLNDDLLRGVVHTEPVYCDEQSVVSS